MEEAAEFASEEKIFLVRNFEVSQAPPCRGQATGNEEHLESAQRCT